MHRLLDLRRIVGPVACAAAIALGGCSVYHDEASGSFSEAALTKAGSDAGIPVQVDGRVGSVQGSPLANAVAAAMPATIGGTAVKYAPCPQYTECPGDHVVWTFGPPPARPASAYPPALGHYVSWLWFQTPSPNTLAVKVAVFQGGNVVASSAGQVDSSDPNDPAFKALIANMTYSVIPGWFDRYNPL